MRKNSFFLAILLVFLISTASKIAAQEKNLRGAELSLKMQSELVKKGFSPVRQDLTATGKDVFPFNILVSFPANTKKIEDDMISNLAIAFTQEEAFEHFEKITEFLNNIRKIEKQCNVEILFSASDLTFSLGKYDDGSELSGTKVYSRSIEDSSDVAALAIRFSPAQISRSEAFPGSKGDSSPSFLVKMLFKAFDETDEKIIIQGSSLSLYRLKILNAENRMQALMENGIPSISVLLSDDEKLKCIEKFVENFSGVESGDWDHHYSFFLNGKIFLSEHFYVLFFLVVSAVSLFFVFAFSFVGNDRHSSILEFFKTVYIYPVTVVVSLLSLTMVQTICEAIPSLKDTSPVAIWTVKVAFAAIFVTVIFVLQERFFGRVRSGVYGYITTIAALTNIIVFSAIDLSFLFVFLTIYIFTYFARSSKTPISLIICFILTLVPFFPYAKNLWLMASNESLKSLVYCSPLKNFVLSLALFPHLMIYLQILHGLKILRPELTLKKRQVFTRALIPLLVFFLILVISVTAVFLLSQSTLLKNENGGFMFFDFTERDFVEKQIFRKERDYLNVTFQEQKSLASNNKIINISTSRPAIKVEVKVFGTESSPVYNSDYNFELEEKEKSATFLIPNQPPQKFSINFVSSESFYVEARAYFEGIENRVFVETFKGEPK